MRLKRTCQDKDSKGAISVEVLRDHLDQVYAKIRPVGKTQATEGCGSLARVSLSARHRAARSLHHVLLDYQAQKQDGPGASFEEKGALRLQLA